MGFSTTSPIKPRPEPSTMATWGLKSPIFPRDVVGALLVLCKGIVHRSIPPNGWEQDAGRNFRPASSLLIVLVGLL